MQAGWLLGHEAGAGAVVTGKGEHPCRQPHRGCHWRVIMCVAKSSRRVQGFLVVENIETAFMTARPAGDGIITYDMQSQVQAELGIRVRAPPSKGLEFVFVRLRLLLRRSNDGLCSDLGAQHHSVSRLWPTHNLNRSACTRFLQYPIHQGLWVHQSHRREGIASRMIDGARASLVAGYMVPVDRCAFSQPTRDGQQFAEAYVGSREYLVYV